MCGRFSLFTPAQIICEYFGLETLNELVPHYNIAPTQNTLIIRQNSHKTREGVITRWGLIPSWTSEEDISGRLINARVESAHIKPSFRSAFKKRRCIIVASGFYEWQIVEGSKIKQPYYITQENQPIIAFAGLWEHWAHGHRIIESCAILTRDANQQMQTVHSRMPVIITPENFDAWLNINDDDATSLHYFITEVVPPRLQLSKVSTAVNNPRVDGPECIQKVV